MIRALQGTLQKLNSHKIITAFLVTVTIVTLGVSSVASAHSNRYPDYFDVDKPGDTAVCEGGSWEKRHHSRWSWHHWRGDNNHHNKHKKWVPNWEKLGFESKRQCIRFVSTEKPTSKQECKEKWWQLGFDSRKDCKRYFKLNPGGGYGG